MMELFQDDEEIYCFFVFPLDAACLPAWLLEADDIRQLLAVKADRLLTQAGGHSHGDGEHGGPGSRAKRSTRSRRTTDIA
jgi:hypothetical protein